MTEANVVNALIETLIFCNDIHHATTHSLQPELDKRKSGTDINKAAITAHETLSDANHPVAQDILSKYSSCSSKVFDFTTIVSGLTAFSVCDPFVNLAVGGLSATYTVPMILLSNANIEASSLLCDITFDRDSMGCPGCSATVSSISDCTHTNFVDYNSVVTPTTPLPNVKILQYDRNDLTMPTAAGNGECHSFCTTPACTTTNRDWSNFETDVSTAIAGAGKTGTYYILEPEIVGPFPDTVLTPSMLLFQEDNGGAFMYAMPPASMFIPLTSEGIKTSCPPMGISLCDTFDGLTYILH